jgi:hypothetical protein
VFSEDIYDLDAKIEPWPHRYFMILVDGDLVAACGLYLRNTYVERYGLVTDEEIAAMLREAGLDGRYDPSNRREVTKVVVARRSRNQRITPVLMCCSLAREFADMEADRPPVVTICVVRTMRRLMKRHGIHTRHIKPFPFYKVHEAYRSESNPMDSYLILPDLDVPPIFRNLAFPGEYDLDAFFTRGGA